MKIKVDKSACIGCGACVAIDSKDFTFDDDGISTPIKDNIEEPTNDLKEAAASCPVNAIKLEQCNCKPCTCEDCKCEKED